MVRVAEAVTTKSGDTVAAKANRPARRKFVCVFIDVLSWFLLPIPEAGSSKFKMIFLIRFKNNIIKTILVNYYF